MIKTENAPRPLSTYEVIKQAEALGNFKDLIRFGIISSAFVTYKQIFEFYLEREKVKETKAQAESDTAEEFGQSERNIRYIVKKMRG